MCGIIYAKNLKDSQSVNQTIKMLYINQRDRGYQGFGIVGLSKDNILYYRSETEKDIMDTLDANNFDEILYHHRYPTSTTNTTKTAHPFKIDYNGKIYYFIHNGVIQNAQTLKQGHDKLKLHYSSHDKKIGTFNDSEALAFNFILALNKQPDTIANGSASIVCLQTDKKTLRAERLYFYTNGGSPLKMFKDNSLFVLSSETGNKDVKPNKLYYYDYATKQIIKDKKIKYKVDQSYYTPLNYSWADDPSDYWATKSYYKSPITPSTDPNTEPDDYESMINHADALTQELQELEKKYNIACLSTHTDDENIALLEMEIDDKQAELDQINYNIACYE